MRVPHSARPRRMFRRPSPRVIALLDITETALAMHATPHFTVQEERLRRFLALGTRRPWLFRRLCPHVYAIWVGV